MPNSTPEKPLGIFKYVSVNIPEAFEIRKSIPITPAFHFQKNINLDFEKLQYMKKNLRPNCWKTLEVKKDDSQYSQRASKT